MKSKFYEWLKSKYGSVAQAPGYTCGESFDAGYEAGQRDMRERAVNVVIDAAESNDGIGCAEVVRAIKLESEL